MKDTTIATRAALPKLPPLRPARIGHVKQNTEGRGSMSTWDRINANGPQLQPRIDGWGGVGPGRWFEVDPEQRQVNGRMSAVGGTCARCGERVRAIDLKLRTTKHGTEYWACNGCTGSKAELGGQAAGWKPNSIKAREMQREHRRMEWERALREHEEALRAAKKAQQRRRLFQVMAAANLQMSLRRTR